MSAKAAARSDRPNRRRGIGNIRRPQIGALFWWTIASIILGIGVLLSWFFSIYIFNNPNEPVPYKILTKLDKLDPPKRFPANAPPPGKFRTPRALMDEDYLDFAESHLGYANDLLMRDYLENFRRAEKVAYVRGTFVVEHVRALTNNDLFQQGLVWRGRSADFPNASIEMILPTGSPVDAGLVAVGQPFAISGAFFATVVHVARPDDRSMCFTLVPIAYGDREIAEQVRLALKPPKRLNLEGTWPLTSPEDVDPSVNVAGVE